LYEGADNRKWGVWRFGLSLLAVAVLGLGTMGCVAHWRAQGNRVVLLPLKEWGFGEIIWDGYEFGNNGVRRSIGGEVYKYGFFERIPKGSPQL
jgi:hypothetical protein